MDMKFGWTKMVAEVFWSGVGYSNIINSHCVTLSVLDAKVEALVIGVRKVAGSVVEVSDELSGDILRMVFKVEEESITFNGFGG